MKIKKLLYATLFSTIWMPAMLHASEGNILEFDALQGKSAGEISRFFTKTEPSSISNKRAHTEWLEFEEICNKKKRKLEETIKKIDTVLKSSGQSVNSIIESMKRISPDPDIKSPDEMLEDLTTELTSRHNAIMTNDVFNSQKDKYSYYQNYIYLKTKIAELEQTNKDLNDIIESYETDAGRNIASLYEERKELKEEIEKLTEYKRGFIRLDSCFIQQIKSLMQIYPSFQKSFFKNYALYSLVNSRGEYVCNKDIWIELLKDSSLFFETLQKDQEIKSLQKEVYKTAMYITRNNQSVYNLQSKLKEYRLSDEGIQEISNTWFNTLELREQFERYTNLREIIREKKEKLNIDSIILETLNGKLIFPGVTNQGVFCKSNLDADFLKPFLYCSIDDKNINSGDILLTWFINPLGETAQKSDRVINDAYNHIFTSLCQDLDVPNIYFPEEEKLGNILSRFIDNKIQKGTTNLDKILTAFMDIEVNKLCKLKEKDKPEEASLSPEDKKKILDQVLNCQLISKISLYNLQAAAITACNIWKENSSQIYKIWNQNTPNTVSIFMTTKMNAEIEETYQRITKNIDQLQYFKTNEVIQKIIGQLASNEASSIFALLSNQNGRLGQNKKTKQNIIKLLDTEIKNITTEMDLLRNQKTNIFHYSYSDMNALAENCVFSWLLDQVVDQKAIPENLTIS